jgi:hypothetical protein
VKNRRKRLRNPSLLGENLNRLEHIPAKRSDQLGVQLDLLVGRPVQHGLHGNDVQPRPRVHEDHSGLEVGEPVTQALLEVAVQHGALVGDVVDQALTGAGVLLQGSLLEHFSLLGIANLFQ